LFALGLLGVSVVHWLRVGLREMGFGWFAFLVVPIVLISFLARMESRWIPEEERRRQWARWLVIGSLMILVVESRLRSYFPPRTSSSAVENSSAAATKPAPPRPHGPSGK